MSLGLVTVLYNSGVFLDEFLASISKQTYTDYTLYLIDNSPHLHSLEAIKDSAKKYNIWEKCVYIPNEDNFGVAKANNIGIKECLKENLSDILILNNDIRIQDPTLIDRLLQDKKENNYKIIAPKIYYYNTQIIWFIKENFNKINGFVTSFGKNKKDIGEFNHYTLAQCAPTCFVIFDKEIFQKVGLFDENYFVYIDDTDFLYRCHLQKYPVHLYTKSYLEHKVSQSTGGESSDFSFFYSLRNRLYYAKKHFKGIYKYYIYSFLLLRYFIFMLKHRKKVSIYIKAIKDFKKLI